MDKPSRSSDKGAWGVLESVAGLVFLASIIAFAAALAGKEDARAHLGLFGVLFLISIPLGMIPTAVEALVGGRGDSADRDWRSPISEVAGGLGVWFAFTALLWWAVSTRFGDVTCLLYRKDFCQGLAGDEPWLPGLPLYWPELLWAGFAFWFLAWLLNAEEWARQRASAKHRDAAVMATRPPSIKTAARLLYANNVTLTLLALLFAVGLDVGPGKAFLVLVAGILLNVVPAALNRRNRWARNVSLAMGASQVVGLIAVLPRFTTKPLLVLLCLVPTTLASASMYCLLKKSSFDWFSGFDGSRRNRSVEEQA